MFIGEFHSRQRFAIHFDHDACATGGLSASALAVGRAFERFQREATDKNILVSCVSFGFRHGVPQDADLVFDVRFLPNPHFVPEFRPLSGRDARVAKYIRSFPQSREFIKRISELLSTSCRITSVKGKAT